MRYVTLITVSFFLSLSHAQEKTGSIQFNLFGGKTFSSFLFKDANGQKNENLGYTSGSTFGASVGFGSTHQFRPEIIYSELGAQSTFNSETVDWKLTYLGGGLSYLFAIVNKETVKLSPGAMIGYDYLLKGDQTSGTVRYNLKESDALKPWDLNAGALLNSRFILTSVLSLNVEYRFNVGLNQIEKLDQGEKSRNIGHRILVGLSFNL
jgi:hypothetical protein